MSSFLIGKDKKGEAFYLKEEAIRTILELDQLIKSSLFALLRLHLAILLAMRQQRHHIQHQNTDTLNKSNNQKKQNKTKTL